jgi:hypothetical protein
MMSDLPTPKIHDIKGKIHAAINAHEAVRKGIASHAEKEQAARQAKFVALETSNKLNGVSKP